MTQRTETVSRRAALELAMAGLCLAVAPAAQGAAGGAAAKDGACAPVRVLFVCPAGTVKSAIARETLRRRAREAGTAVEVASRGVHPEDHVSPRLAERLAADGIDTRREPLRALTPADVAAADIVVAFDAAAQAPGLGGARAWSTPSWNSDYPAAKTDLAQRLDGLLAELKAQPCRGGP